MNVNARTDFSNVKSGDTLYIETNMSQNSKPVLVDKVTKTLIILNDGRRFSKSDGIKLPRSALQPSYIRINPK